MAGSVPNLMQASWRFLGRRSLLGPWLFILVLTVGTWCCVRWALSESAANRPHPIVTESSPLIVRVGVYLFSGKWHADLAGGLILFLFAAVVTGIQSLFNLVRIRHWERKQGRSWEYVGEARDCTAIQIEGVSVWKHEWQPLNVLPAAVLGRDGEFRRVPVYEIVVDGRRITFAADECAPGGWAFFRPKRAELRL
jgi:hypothetical protein